MDRDFAERIEDQTYRGDIRSRKYQLHGELLHLGVHISANRLKETSLESLEKALELFRPEPKGKSNGTG